MIEDVSPVFVSHVPQDVASTGQPAWLMGKTIYVPYGNLER